MRATRQIDYAVVLFESGLQLYDLPALIRSVIYAREVLTILVIAKELHLIVGEDNGEGHSACRDQFDCSLEMVLLIVLAVRLILNFPADDQAAVDKEHHGSILASGDLPDHWLKTLSVDVLVLINIAHTVGQPLILAPAEVH